MQCKITQICGVDGEDTGSLQAGEIGVVYGLGTVKVGQVIGDASLLPRRVQPGALRTPLTTVRVETADAQQQKALALPAGSSDPYQQRRRNRPQLFSLRTAEPMIMTAPRMFRGVSGSFSRKAENSRAETGSI